LSALVYQWRLIHRGSHRREFGAGTPGTAPTKINVSGIPEAMLYTSKAVAPLVIDKALG
jgi:hypothetical protein